MKPVEYTVFDENGMKAVYCMKGCGVQIAKRKMQDGKPTGSVIHMSHSKNYPVTLEDGSYSNMLVCAKCYNKITDADLPNFQETQRWGWKKEWEEIHKQKILVLILLLEEVRF